MPSTRPVCGRLTGWRRIALLAAFAWLGLGAGPAGAAVEIGFHSKEFGSSFPHGFITLNGTVDATGEPVHDNFGFTVRHLIGPSILFGSVHGAIYTESEESVADSNHHFSMMLTDEQYRGVLALVERWRALPQPSYSIQRRNCVTFVAEVANLLGLEADARGYMRRPKLFLEHVRERNAAVIAAAAPPAVPPSTMPEAAPVPPAPAQR